MFSLSLSERWIVLGFNFALYTCFPLSSIWEIARDSGVASNRVNAPLSPLKNLKIGQNEHELSNISFLYINKKKLYQLLLLFRESYTHSVWILARKHCQSETVQLARCSLCYIINIKLLTEQTDRPDRPTRQTELLLTLDRQTKQRERLERQINNRPEDSKDWTDRWIRDLER